MGSNGRLGISIRAECVKKRFAVDKEGKLPDGQTLLEWIAYMCSRNKGKQIQVEIKGEPKTKEQLGYYYTGVIPSMREFCQQELGWTPDQTQDVQLDRIIKENVGWYETKMLGETPCKILKLKRDSDIESMSKLTDLAIHWLREIGCFVAPPIKQMREDQNDNDI